MKFKKVFFVVIIIILAIIPVKGADVSTGNQVFVNCKITGADGKSPILANASLSEISEYIYDPIQSVQAGADGKFTMNIKGPGLYKLWITAVNHETLQIPLIITKDDQKIDINVTLTGYTKPNNLEEIKIIGSWNSFDFRKAEPMQRRPDGTFVYERSVEGNSISYQLKGVIERNLIPGTTSDSYEYDNMGGYKSIIKVKPGKVKIVFNPSLLAFAKEEDRPLVVYGKKHDNLKTIFDISYQWQQTISKYSKAMKEWHATNTVSSKFSFDCPEFISTLERILNNTNDLMIKQYANIYYLHALAISNQLDTEKLKKILSITPPSSIYWGIQPNAIVVLSTGLIEESPEILEDFYKQNPNRIVQARALISMALIYQKNGAEDKVKELYLLLKSKYADLKDIEREITGINPDRLIQRGKPVPSFNIKTFDGEIVSNKILTGKYYLMDFWASWCGSCIEEMSYLHKAYEKYSSKGLIVISLSMDYSQKEVEKFRADKWPMPWMHFLVEGGFNDKIVRDFELRGLPHPVFIGPDGIILAVDAELRGEMLEKTLGEYLK